MLFKVIYYLQVRKFESLSTKSMHFCKNLPLALDIRQSKYSL